MTSLEFIEKEIKNIKEFLSDSVNVIGKNTKDTNFWEQRLYHFQQIKAELEAWEVVKKKVKPILKMDKEDYQPAYYWWIANELINLDILDYQTLKNVLEVKKDE